MTVRKNLSIMGGAGLFEFALNFGTVLIISRLLTPAEIGVFSVSVAVIGLAHIFREFGIGNYLVQTESISSENFRAAFSVTLYTSWFIACCLFLLRHPFATLYDHAGIANVLLILSFNFVALPFGTPLLSVIRRDLQFKKLARISIFTTFIQTSVTLGCAFAGQSYLSMAWGGLAANVSKVVLLNFMRPGEIFMLPTVKGLGKVLRFGAVSSLTSIVKELGSSAPSLILGRTLGFVEVAFYSRAVGLKKMLIERLINLIRGVHFPTFANHLRQGGDGAKLYIQTMCYMVAVIGPVLAVLAVLSEPLIVFLFGDQWQRSAYIATLICAYSILTTPYSLYALSLIAAGKVTLSLKTEIAIQTSQVLVLLSSVWFQLELVVTLLIFVYLAEVVFSHWSLKRAFGLGCSELFVGIRSSLVLIPASVAGPVFIIYLSHQWGLTESRFLILAISGILAGAGWLGAVMFTNHLMKVEVISIYEKVFQRRIK